MRGLGVDYSSQIAALAPSYGIPPQLAIAVAQRESSLNPNAVSPKGAIGLFQLMPSTAAGLNVNPSDPTQNIQGGLAYLKQMYDKFGNWNDALVAYNEGPGAFQQSGAYPSAAAYASSILAAAGFDTSPVDTPSDSPVSSPLAASMDWGVLSDLPTSTGLSGSTIAVLAGVGIVMLIWWNR